MENLAPNADEKRHRLGRKEGGEFLISEHMHHRDHVLRETLRRGAVHGFRQAEELLLRAAIALRGFARQRVVGDARHAEGVLIDFTHALALLRFLGEIRLREIKPDAAAVHPTGLAGAQLHLAPFHAFVGLKGEGLVVLHLGDDGRSRALVAANIHVPVRIIDYAAVLGMGEADATREREQQQAAAMQMPGGCLLKAPHGRRNEERSEDEPQRLHSASMTGPGVTASCGRAGPRRR